MIWLFLWLALAQGVITPEKPVVLTLAGDMRPVDVLYEGRSDERITVTARSRADTPIDIVLEILYGERLIAFNDDHMSASAGLLETDAAVVDLALPSTGVYTLRVNSFNGVQAGEVEISIDAAPTVQDCILPLTAGELRANERFRCWLTLENGQSAALTVRDLSGTLDPLVLLYSAQDNLVGSSDDHNTYDLSLNRLDARLVYTHTGAAAVYTVQVVDFAGMPGRFELSIEIKTQP